MDVRAFNGAAEAIPELLYVGPIATGRWLEFHLLRASLRERLELHILVVVAESQRHCHFLDPLESFKFLFLAARNFTVPLVSLCRFKITIERISR